MHWIPGAGHNSNTDAPELVNRAIEEFVAALVGCAHRKTAERVVWRVRPGATTRPGDGRRAALALNPRRGPQFQYRCAGAGELGNRGVRRYAGGLTNTDAPELVNRAIEKFAAALAGSPRRYNWVWEKLWNAGPGWFGQALQLGLGTGGGPACALDSRRGPQFQLRCAGAGEPGHRGVRRYAGGLTNTDAPELVSRGHRGVRRRAGGLCPSQNCGTRDLAGSARRCNRAWERAVGQPVHWIPGAGHNSNADAPELVNRVIEEFIAALAG